MVQNWEKLVSFSTAQTEKNFVTKKWGKQNWLLGDLMSRTRYISPIGWKKKHENSGFVVSELVILSKYSKGGLISKDFY